VLLSLACSGRPQLIERTVGMPGLAALFAASFSLSRPRLAHNRKFLAYPSKLGRTRRCDNSTLQIRTQLQTAVRHRAARRRR
jgi:hypothetical protein